MIKKLFVLCVLFALTSSQGFSLQLQESQLAKISGSSEKQVKIYNSRGSLQGYMKPQNNGTIKTYNKYHQYNGYYKKDGSKVKYYTK